MIQLDARGTTRQDGSMRKNFATVAVGTILAFTVGCATTSGGEPSRLEVAVEKTAKDLLAVGKEFAKAGAIEACLVVTRNALEALKELSTYANLLPGPEAFCSTFFEPGREPEPEIPAKPGVRL